MNMKSETKSADPEGAQSIQRALRVLKYLSSQVAQPPTAADVAAQCALTKPTAHRILGALTAEGFANLDETTRAYSLGLESYALGISASQRFDLAFFSRASLQRISKSTRDTSFLTICSGDEALCIGREIGDFPIKILTLDVGHRRPLGVGAGSLALLAFMADDDVERVLANIAPALTPYPGFSVEGLREQIAQARALGYTYNEGRLIPEMSAIGMPILDESGTLLGSLSVAAITSRVSGKHRERLVDILRKEAALITAAVGQQKARPKLVTASA